MALSSTSVNCCNYLAGCRTRYNIPRIKWETFLHLRKTTHVTSIADWRKGIIPVIRDTANKRNIESNEEPIALPRRRRYFDLQLTMYSIWPLNEHYHASMQQVDGSLSGFQPLFVSFSSMLCSRTALEETGIVYDLYLKELGSLWHSHQLVIFRITL